MTKNFVAFCRRGDGRRKGTKPSTSFDVQYKWSNLKILGKSLKETKIFASPQSMLLSRYGDNYTSCNLVPAQQHGICCMPLFYFSFFKGSVFNLLT